MKHFFGLALATVVAVALLCGLGVWQLSRKAEKETLIAALDARIAAAPVALPAPRDWGALTPAQDEFRRVRFTATLNPGEARVYAGAGSSLRADVSGPGVWVFAAAVLASGETVVVDRGFAADGEENRIAAVSDATEFVGVIRFPEQRGFLTPDADRARNLWFARDHLSMAQAKGWGAVAPFYVDLEAPAPPGGVPKPGPVVPHLRNEHLNYALTWFGLALVWLASFLVWAVQQRRRASETADVEGRAPSAPSARSWREGRGPRMASPTRSVPARFFTAAAAVVRSPPSR